MAPRIPRLRRKPAAIPFQPLRNRSFGALGSDVRSATDVLDRYERRISHLGAACDHRTLELALPRLRPAVQPTGARSGPRFNAGR
ncbi:hypothetical protein AB0C40_31085 [Streptomyces brevispora]|uniref:hypothetical protein n=1 Tax=Streptomyces brevispora TaxID=887462 RepID=UPI0033D75846